MPLDPAFVKATNDVKKLTVKPTSEEQLQLYGLYKVAHSENFSVAKKPAIYHIEEKYKYAAWKKVVDEGVKPAEAQKQYIALAEQHKVTYKYDATKKV